MLATGVTLTLYGASRAALTNWANTNTTACLGTGAVLLLGYVLWALRREQPAVDLTLLRHGQSALALILSVVSSVVAFSAVFLLAPGCSSSTPTLHYG